MPYCTITSEQKDNYTARDNNTSLPITLIRKPNLELKTGQRIHYTIQEKEINYKPAELGAPPKNILKKLKQNE